MTWQARAAATAWFTFCVYGGSALGSGPIEAHADQVWRSPVAAALAVKHDSDPGRIIGIECAHAGRKAHGGWRRFNCVASGPQGCTYIFRVRFTTEGIRYRAYDGSC